MALSAFISDVNFHWFYQKHIFIISAFIYPTSIDLPRILTLRGSSDLLVERRLREKERSIHSLLSPIPRTSCSLEITLYS